MESQVPTAETQVPPLDLAGATKRKKALRRLSNKIKVSRDPKQTQTQSQLIRGRYWPVAHPGFHPDHRDACPACLPALRRSW
jgi:hypothetical protein